MVYTIILVCYGLFETVLIAFAILGFISWRIWSLPVAWILNKVMRKQYGICEVQSKGNKILAFMADFTKDFAEKYGRLYNLGDAKRSNLVFYKYGVPHIHFDEEDSQPKAFHPQRETEAEKARNSTGISNLVANVGTFYKRFAMSLEDRRFRWVLIGIGLLVLMAIVQVILSVMVMNALGSIGNGINALIGANPQFNATIGG